ncbi:MAG: flippase [Desulfomonile tiedjei]|nr:flippase [Desulfomonile tiedjei]
MGLRLSIFKNTLALSVPNMLNPLISFALVLVISRYLGVNGLGQYSLILSFMWIFNTLASLGLGSLVVREVAKRPADAHMFLFNACIFGTISSLVSLLAMDAAVFVMGYERDLVHAALVCSLTIVITTTTNYMEAIFRSLEKAQYIALTYVLENVVRVAACVSLLLYGYGIVALFTAILVSRFLGFLLLSYLYVKVFGMPRGKYNREVWQILRKEAPTFTSIAIFSTIHLSVAQILLSKLQSVEAVGIFSAADRLLSICKTIPEAASAALLPFFTRHFASGSDDLRRLSTDCLRWLFLAILPVVVGTFILADNIITMIYGQKFVSAGQVLRFHILSLLPFAMVIVLAHVLIATNNQKVDLMINIAAAIINFVLCLLLIPYFAEMGAVWATLLTVIVFNQLQNAYIRRNLFRIRFREIVAKALIASLGMGAVTYVLREWNIFLNIAISGVVYMLLVLLVQGISREEIQSLRNLVPRRARKTDG